MFDEYGGSVFRFYYIFTAVFLYEVPLFCFAKNMFGKVWVSDMITYIDIWKIDFFEVWTFHY